jgi:hypothetical protein
MQFRASARNAILDQPTYFSPLKFDFTVSHYQTIIYFGPSIWVKTYRNADQISGRAREHGQANLVL